MNRIIASTNGLWSTGEPGWNEPMRIRTELQQLLATSLKAKDADAVSACRTTLAAIANAEAVPVTSGRAHAIEQSPVGVGAAEAPRRELTEVEVERIVRAELDERLEAAPHFTGHRATRLAAEIRVLEAVLGG